MNEEKSAGCEEGCSDGQQDQKSPNHSIFDEHDRVDNDAGSYHGVGDAGNDFERTVGPGNDSDGFSEFLYDFHFFGCLQLCADINFSYLNIDFC